MSAILQQLKDAQLKARKARDSITLTSLITLIGEITTVAKSDGNREVTDKDCIKKLTAFRDNATTNAQIYGERRDSENFEAYSNEASLYDSFLPAPKAQLSDEALHRSIRSIIASRLAGDGQKPKMGTVIADLKLLHEGEYDPKAAAAVVKSELEGMPAA